MSYMYVAIIAEAVNGHINNYCLGIYDSYSKAKNEVTEHITRQYIDGRIRDRVLIPTVTKYVVNGGFIDEWCGKELYNNNDDRR